MILQINLHQSEKCSMQITKQLISSAHSHDALQMEI